MQKLLLLITFLDDERLTLIFLVYQEFTFKAPTILNYTLLAVQAL